MKFFQFLNLEINLLVIKITIDPLHQKHNLYKQNPAVVTK